MDDQGTDRTSGGIRLRELRIAWSVACGIACVPLIFLWVRSYYTCDLIIRLPARGPRFGLVSIEGRVHLFGRFERPASRVQLLSLPVEEVSMNKDVFMSNKAVFRIASNSPRFDATYGLLIALVAPLGIVPWVEWSRGFTLRTLLIVTTLVAVVLGAIVYAVRNN